ncbi:MAG: ABC transporter ATP-binding protein [Deltaproteobacteria bacterium]|nr:ABC transporter ATP-binding protein [Deltaproteobacteria bacterium]MBN2672640.1 ABC transporter ATP-binding protein [Deltaproteobacteria bacterium]
MTETYTLKKVKKIYRQGAIEVPALRGINLEISPREFTVISGPSGSGKSTLLNIMGALDVPTEGSISLEGKEFSGLSKGALSDLRRDRIGFVFQAYNLIPVLSAFENAEMVMSLQGVSKKERAEKVMHILEEVGLKDLAHRRPNQLSGGQQQRVAIARAIASDPAVILADEPTANVDSKTAAMLLDVMERLNREKGTTFVFSTHDPHVMERAKRSISLVDGCIENDVA